jgi:hypothetical protein
MAIGIFTPFSWNITLIDVSQPLLQADFTGLTEHCHWGWRSVCILVRRIKPGDMPGYLRANFLHKPGDMAEFLPSVI